MREREKGEREREAERKEREREAERKEREREKGEREKQRDSLCFATKPLKLHSKALAYEDNISLFDY